MYSVVMIVMILFAGSVPEQRRAFGGGFPLRSRWSGANSDWTNVYHMRFARLIHTTLCTLPSHLTFRSHWSLKLRSFRNKIKKNNSISFSCFDHLLQMWHCVEERVTDIDDFGRLRRKIIFDDVFTDRNALLGNNPIPEGTQGHLQVLNNVVN